MMNARDVEKALSRRYGAPEQALFFNVPCTTGGGASRLADAVAMELWPSRGLCLHAFEIKVNRYDWTKNELKNPAKAEKFYDLCDFFWMVTPDGIIKDGELPIGWGHIIVNEDFTSKVIIKATLKTNTRDGIPRAFAASLFRAAHVQADAIADMKIDVRMANYKEEVERKAKEEISNRTPAAYAALQERYTRLLKCLGFEAEDYNHGWGYLEPPEKIGEFYKAFKTLGIAGSWRTVEAIITEMDEVRKKLAAAIKPFEGMMEFNQKKTAIERLKKR